MLFPFIFLLSISTIKCAKILAVFPTPSISHQIVFRPITQELARRGHEVIIVTPDPAFPKGQTPKNIIEIDMQNVSYAVKNALLVEYEKNLSVFSKYTLLTQLFFKVFKVQVQSENFQKILQLDRQYFDLLLVEACVVTTLGLSHVFNAPVIQVSSLGSMLNNHESLNIPMHPFVYPTSMRNRLYNLTFTEKLQELISLCVSKYIYSVTTETLENQMLRENFGHDIPTLDELRNNIDMLFLNSQPVWSGNYPVPPNVIFMGGIHQKEMKELPQDLKSWLDSSKNGVIYVSFGTNLKSVSFSSKTKHLFENVFSNIPYDVLLKWDEDETMGQSKNIKISKWLPQADLLRHPKIKLFITQGGLQSTDEAITAGVPLIGIPIIADQAFNAEKYVHFNIGVKLDIQELTKQKLKDSIYMVIGDENYRKNIVKLRTLMNDQPQSPLERVVWWTEYVLRNGGARHLRSPAANMSWMEYCEVKFISVVLSIFLLLIVLLVSFTKYLLRLSIKLLTKAKVKIN